MKPSLRDRLMMVEDREFSVLDHYTIDELKQDVRRSLERLFNCRRAHNVDHEKFGLLANSSYCYGIPDFSELSLGGMETIDKLLNEIRTVVPIYEPRLTDVTVEKTKGGEESRILSFHVHGWLRRENEILGEVQYDSQVASVENSVEVSLQQQ